MHRFSLDYIAGFFDGEGSIGIYTTGKVRLYLKVQITQTKNKFSTELFDYLVETYGGTYSHQLSTSGREKYLYQISNVKARKFLEALLPFLIFKKEQAEIAIKWQLPRSSKPARDKLGRILPMVQTSEDIAIAARLKALKKIDD